MVKLFNPLNLFRKPNKKDPLVANHFCPYKLENGKKCKGTIFENKKLDFQLKGECGKACPFMAKFFSMVYIEK